MMTPDGLKKRVVKEFKSGGLLKGLDVETCVFRELPRFFEASHLSMRLVIDDIAAVAAASRAAAEIKRDLERKGVELEYEIRPQWSVVSLCSDAVECCVTASRFSSADFQVELKSGAARRWVAIHLSAGARTCILQYLAHVPPADQESAIYKLLEVCLNQKLSSCGEEYWDPVLYPSRNIELQDVARIAESWVDSHQPELAPVI